MSKPHILLIHGAWHRAWHMKLVEEELEKAGYTSSAIDLPSVGDDAPEEGAMSADAEAIKNALEDIALNHDSIIPLFHSYAGIPGGDGAASVNQATAAKIKRLIYLAAFVRQQGESLSSPFGGHVSPWIKHLNDGKITYVEEPIPVFYNSTSLELAEAAAKRLDKMPRCAFNEATQHCGWKKFPSTYIFCADDQAVPASYAQSVFDAQSEDDRANWQFETLQGDHSPFLGRPAELAQLVRKIAGEEL